MTYISIMRLGGLIGAICQHQFSSRVQSLFKKITFPFGILVLNLPGYFVFVVGAVFLFCGCLVGKQNNRIVVTFQEMMSS